MDYRNPNLADAMRVSGLAQRYGVGIPLSARAACQQSAGAGIPGGCPPGTMHRTRTAGLAGQRDARGVGFPARTRLACILPIRCLTIWVERRCTGTPCRTSASAKGVRSNPIARRSAVLAVEPVGNGAPAHASARICRPVARCTASSPSGHTARRTGQTVWRSGLSRRAPWNQGRRPGSVDRRTGPHAAPGSGRMPC